MKKLSLLLVLFLVSPLATAGDFGFCSFAFRAMKNGERPTLKAVVSNIVPERFWSRYRGYDEEYDAYTGPNKKAAIEMRWEGAVKATISPPEAPAGYQRSYSSSCGSYPDIKDAQAERERLLKKNYEPVTWDLQSSTIGGVDHSSAKSEVTSPERTPQKDNTTPKQPSDFEKRCPKGSDRSKCVIHASEQ